MSRWVVGVDLGQTIDPTAIAVLEITTRRDILNAHLADPDGPDRPPMTWYRTKGDARVLAEPDSPARIDVRHLERLPLRMDYTAQVEMVGALLRRPPLPRGTRLVIDQTGVGRPVVNMFTAAGLNPVGVTITGGDSETRVSWGQEEFRVAKLLLVSRLQAAFHSGTLRIAKALPEASVLVSELSDFRAQFAPTGYARFGAREGAHDDLVLALAIGVWWSSRPRNSARVGSFSI